MLIIRLLPYDGCLLTAIFVGLAILKVGGDLVFSGSILVFFVSQILYITALGLMSLLLGWTVANPGVAASRMILFYRARATCLKKQPADREILMKDTEEFDICLHRIE